MEEVERNLYIFDFDGVLVKPYTDPEEIFPGVTAYLRKRKAEGHIITVCSFNPRSYTVLKPLLEDGTITAIRAGSKALWWEEGPYSDEKHRVHMQKGLFIEDMLAKELAEVGPFNRIFFIDDDEQNIDAVFNHASTFGNKWGAPLTCLLVQDSFRGLAEYMQI